MFDVGVINLNSKMHYKICMYYVQCTLYINDVKVQFTLDVMIDYTALVYNLNNF